MLKKFISQGYAIGAHVSFLDAGIVEYGTIHEHVIHKDEVLGIIVATNGTTKLRLRSLFNVRKVTLL